MPPLLPADRDPLVNLYTDKPSLSCIQLRAHRMLRCYMLVHYDGANIHVAVSHLRSCAGSKRANHRRVGGIFVTTGNWTSSNTSTGLLQVSWPRCLRMWTTSWLSQMESGTPKTGRSVRRHGWGDVVFRKFHHKRLSGLFHHLHQKHQVLQVLSPSGTRLNQRKRKERSSGSCHLRKLIALRRLDLLHCNHRGQLPLK